MPDKIIACAIWTDTHGHAHVRVVLENPADAASLKVKIFDLPDGSTIQLTGKWIRSQDPDAPNIVEFENADNVLPQNGTIVSVEAKRTGNPELAWVETVIAVVVNVTNGSDVASSIDSLGDKLGVARKQFDSDFLAYPLLTSDGEGASFASSGRVTDSLGAAVDEEIRALLGRVPASDDVTSITSSLESSFTVQDEDGVESLGWVPPTASQGARIASKSVTGVQQNLVMVSQTLLANARQAVPSLQPIWIDDLADTEEIQADKDILLGAIDDFLGEVGADGGPSRPKVNVSLLHMKEAVADLGIRLGMRGPRHIIRTHVVTPNDELALTQYIIAAKAVQIVGELWSEYEPQSVGQLPKDLGTRFFLLEQALSRSSELVDEVYTALGSLYVDRQLCAQTILKPLGLTIDQVFWWVKSYLTDEAIALVQQAGVRGAALIAQTLGAVSDAQTMIGVVDEVRKVQANPDSDRTIPEGFYHPRARRPVNELLNALVEAAAAAKAAGSSGVFNAKTQLESRRPGDTVNIDKLILIEQ